MTRLFFILLCCIVVQACSEKDDLAERNVPNGFPDNPNPLPSTLVGKWIRTKSLRTFDFKPDEWVEETGDANLRKYLQFAVNKTYSSNHVTCIDCRVELFRDTLYVQHSKGFYKFPVLQLNDTLLHIKTKIDQADYSLPNTGLFDFILEEKYRKQQ